MKYKHNYIIDVVFAVILIAVIGYALKGTLSHMDEVHAAEVARAATETELQTESETEETAAPVETEKETETKAAVKEYEVVGGVNFRAEANGDSEIIDMLPDGAVVELIDKDNSDWWHVSHEGQEGYIYSEFLTEH